MQKSNKIILDPSNHLYICGSATDFTRAPWTAVHGLSFYLYNSKKN